MIIVDQQLHGYRHGHELLSASIRLPSTEQDLVDRMSDVAGPLGPGERFAPYLTCYPLSSGSHYVFARTWQDTAASRSGCVRTRSLLIPTVAWMEMYSPASLADLVDSAGPNGGTDRIELGRIMPRLLPKVEGAGIELLEALFLEERLPVAVFGAELPEIAALRLLTAMWPAYRRRFALSTFCNSPRSISRRSFDLVFAPVDARSRFAGWKGRRVDGGRRTEARHRWTSAIAESVFRADHPSLLNLDSFGAMTTDLRGDEDVLRVSLLWNDLMRKTSSEPSAILGLLDIANSRAPGDVALLRSLEQLVVSAAARVTDELSATEAWGFLGTLVGKLGRSASWHGSSAIDAICAVAVPLAGSQAEPAVKALPRLLREDATATLVGAIGKGLAQTMTLDMVGAFAQVGSNVLASILIRSRAFLEAFSLADPDVSAGLLTILIEGDKTSFAAARSAIVPLLVSPEAIGSYRFLVRHMDVSELEMEIVRLGSIEPTGLDLRTRVVIDAAMATGSVGKLKDRLLSLMLRLDADELLHQLLEPTSSDLNWILNQPILSDDKRRAAVLALIRKANASQLQAMFTQGVALAHISLMFGKLDAEEARQLLPVVDQVRTEPMARLELTVRLLPHLRGRSGSKLAYKALQMALVMDLGNTRAATIAYLLKRSAKELDGARILRLGLLPDVSSRMASQNLILLAKSPPNVREKIFEEPEALVGAIIDRDRFDISYEGAQAASFLLQGSEDYNRKSFLHSCAALLPFMMKRGAEAASPLIVASFPAIYREIRQESLPSFLTFVFPFLDWDRCRVARRSLAEAFSRSRWRASDMAIAAIRADDVERILRQFAKRSRPARFLARIEDELDLLPKPWRDEVGIAIAKLRMEGFD